MPHIPSPRYFASRRAYYVQLNGKQHCLANGEICEACQGREGEGLIPTCKGCLAIRQAADLRFAELVHNNKGEKPDDGTLVSLLCTRYLRHVEANAKPKTYSLALANVTTFSDECGRMRLHQLLPLHLQDLLNTRKTWGPATRRQFIMSVQAVFNHFVKMGSITRNPLAGFAKPPKVSRGKDHVISDADHKTIMDYLSSRPVNGRSNGEALARVLRILFHTGARPSEVFSATAHDWNPDLRAFVYPKVLEPLKVNGFTHKNCRRKERVIFISDAKVLEDIQALISKYPVGPLYRNHKGEVWTNKNMGQRFTDLRRGLPISRKCMPYSYRHRSITLMILRGVPMAHVAELHGTSVEMLVQHYAHLDAHTSKLGEIWAKAKVDG